VDVLGDIESLTIQLRHAASGTCGAIVVEYRSNVIWMIPPGRDTDFLR
jgi:hypothetical protein